MPKPSLLQWFREENLPQMYYNEGEEVFTQPSLQGTSILTLQLTSLFPSSVENQRGLGNTFQAMTPMKKLILKNLPTRIFKSEMPWFSEEEAKLWQQRL